MAYKAPAYPWIRQKTSCQSYISLRLTFTNISCGIQLKYRLQETLGPVLLSAIATLTRKNEFTLPGQRFAPEQKDPRQATHNSQIILNERDSSGFNDWKTMQRQRKIIVLYAYRPFLHILNAFDMESFRIPVRCIRPLNIGRPMAIFVVSFVYGIALFADLWYCIEHQFNLNEIALSFAILLSASQNTIMYTSIVAKKRLASSVIDHLNGLIDERKWHHWLFNGFMAFIGGEPGLFWKFEVDCLGRVRRIFFECISFGMKFPLQKRSEWCRRF